MFEICLGARFEDCFPFVVNIYIFYLEEGHEI